MYVVPPYRAAVSLFSRDGLVRTFPTKAAALRELGYDWIAHNVGADFRSFSHVERFALDVFGEPIYRTFDYVLRDDAGEPLTAADFYELSRELRKVAGDYWSRRYGAWNGEGPVPGTAKRSGGYRYFRRVHTFGARRDAHHFAEEGEVAPRPGRNMANIPTNYDDIARGMSRSWKKHRKTRWKERK